MKKCVSILIFFLLFHKLFCLELSAQNEIMEPIVVTSTKIEKQEKKLSTNVMIVSKDEIETYQADNVMTLIQKLSGQNIIDSGTGSYYVGFRGNPPAPKGVLIMMDGVELNTPTNYILAQNIPFQNIERIEIIKKTSSSLYGPAAVGGIINIITQQPKQKVESELSFLYKTYNAKESRLYLGGMSNNWLYRMNYAFIDTNGYRENSERQYHIITPRLGFKGEHFDLNILLNIVSNQGDVPGGLPFDTFQDNPKESNMLRSDGKGFSTTLGTVVDYYLSDSSVVHLKTTHRTDDWWAEMDSNYLKGDDQKQWNSEMSYQKDFICNSFTNKLLTGFEYRDFHSMLMMHPDDYWADKTYWWKSQNVIDENNWGGFIQNEIDYASMLTVDFGIRFDHIHMKYTDDINSNNSSDSSHEKWSPRIGFSYYPEDYFNIFANYSQGIRSVNLVDTVWKPKASLKPEKQESYELGFNFKQMDQCHYKISAFYTTISDYIIETGSGQSMDWENTGEVESKGLEASVLLQFFQNILLDLDYTYQQSTFKQYKTPTDSFTGNDVPLIPKHMFNFNLGLLTNDFGQINFSGRFVDEKYLDKKNDLKLDRYSVFDFKYTYTKNALKFNLALTNVLNKTYTDFGKMNGGAYVGYLPVVYPAEGRVLSASISYRF
jgi:outer membrane receptor protein involved in Fe transport